MPHSTMPSGMHLVLLHEVHPVLHRADDLGLVVVDLGAGLVHQVDAVLDGERLEQPVREARRRDLHAPLRDLAARVALGELLRVLGGLLPGPRRLVGVEPGLLEELLVVVHHDRRALERDAPRLAVGLAVLHERRVEALQPRAVVVGLDQVVERDDRVLVDQREHVGRQQDRHDRRLAALDGGQRLGDRLLVAARVDGLQLDAGILLLEVGGVAVDDLGDRARRPRRDRRTTPRRAPARPRPTTAARRQIQPAAWVSQRRTDMKLLLRTCDRDSSEARSLDDALRQRRAHAGRIEIVLRAGRPRQPCRVAARSATVPGTRTASGCSPTRQATSESPPRYSTVSTPARSPRSNATWMCSGRTPSVPPAAVGAAATPGRRVPATRAPPRAGLERQQVHRRRADEARDEQVGRRLVELDRRAVLLDAPGVEQQHAIGHRHRLDLVVRDVHHRDAELALQRADLRRACRRAAARRGSTAARPSGTPASRR